MSEPTLEWHVFMMVTVGPHAAAATSSDLQAAVLLQPILSQILQMQVAVEFQSRSVEIKIPRPDWGETPVPLLPKSNRARVEIFPANYAGWKPGCKLWGMEQCWLKERGRRQDKKCSQKVNCDKE